MWGQTVNTVVVSAVERLLNAVIDAAKTDTPRANSERAPHLTQVAQVEFVDNPARPSAPQRASPRLAAPRRAPPGS
ncbi:hypothetical protein BJY52DRAFT_1196513 [Lactarius psammicola]|nr:hypothetical protein BJY52DRAFT_1196513 [Lactarius psammicola]